MVLMELQYSGRASLSTMEVEEVLGREKEATKGRDVQVSSPSSPPTIYRGAKGGLAGPRRSNLLGGAAAKGGFPSPQGT